MSLDQKSIKQRVMFTLGVAFFLIYLALGLAFVFVKQMPFNMSPALRIGFGIVLIAYSGTRLYRLVKQVKN